MGAKAHASAGVIGAAVRMLGLALLLLMFGCATYDHRTKSAPDKARDEVECKALAKQGAQHEFLQGTVYHDLLIKCLASRGWEKTS